MKAIDNDEFKRIALEILKDFDRVCRKNNISYSLAYGTLIGAVRHQGYIPWDDDIDVVMLRDDYEKFVSVKDDLSDIHTFISLETDQKYSASLAKIYDNRTTLKELKHRDLVDIGVYIDVFVFDYVPERKVLRKLLYYRAAFARRLWAFSTYYSRTKLPLERMLRQYAAKHKIGRKANLALNSHLKKRKKSALVCAMLFVYDWDWETFYTKEFHDLIVLPFEGESFLAFKNYDMFLKRWYGDYMKLPPPEERIVGHTYEVYYK